MSSSSFVGMNGTSVGGGLGGGHTAWKPASTVRELRYKDCCLAIRCCCLARLPATVAHLH